MNRLARLFSVICIPALAAGCIEEYIPEGGTITKDQLDQSVPVEKILNGIPSAMMTAGTGGYYDANGDQTDFGLPSIHLRTDYMLSDLVSVGMTNYNQFNYYVACIDMGQSSQWCAYFWDVYYQWIRSANDVISRIDPETEDAQLKKCLAQAYTYRAMCYLDLARLYIPLENDYVRVYANVRNLTVPIVDETTTEEKATDNPRATAEQMYTFITKDLGNAVKLFGDSASSSYTEPTLAAAYGLFARAYLEWAYLDTNKSTEYFKNAFDYADLAITKSGRTPLTKEQWTDPSNGFNNGSAVNSWIWGLTLNASSTSNIMNYTAFMSSEATWAYGCRTLPGINSNLYDKIKPEDWRRLSWLDPEWEGWGKGGTKKYDYQFAGKSEDKDNFLSYAKPYTNLKFRPAMGECSNYTVGVCADHPLMRVEEMWFIKMESLAKRSDVPAASKLLSEFMELRGYAANSCTSAGLDAFIEDMIFQKRIEFWGEGILMYDYKRLDLGFERTNANFDPNFAYNIDGRSPQWNVVIPRSEIQGNTAVAGLNNPDPTAFWANIQQM